MKQLFFRSLFMYAVCAFLYNTSGFGQSISVITNGPQTISVNSASLTSTASSNNTINSTKWTKFSVPGQALKKVTVIGSSTAAGNGVTNGNNAIVSKLRAYYQAEGIASDFINLAVAGTRPFDIDINAALNNTAPDILLVCYPSNGYTASNNGNVINRYFEFQNACNSRGIQMIVTGTQPRDDFNPDDRANLITMNNLFRTNFPDRFIDFLTPLLNPNGNTMKTEYRADGIHPNDAGHEVIYQLTKAFNIFQFSHSSASGINTPNSGNTIITNLASGVHRFQVAVGDVAGFAASTYAMITVNGNGNGGPGANAGSPLTITLPGNSVTLNGSGSAGNGGTITFAWTQIGGPSQPLPVIVSPISAVTQVTGLVQGVYTFRLTVTQNDGQTATNTVAVTVNAGAAAKIIPGKIEAEAWDAKSGPQYIVTSTDAGGGQMVIGIANGSWMDYNVNVQTTGTYTVNFRIATTQANAQFQLKSGNTVLGTITMASTGSWGNWATVPLTNVSLTAGVQALRILCVTSASANFNWMDFVLTSAPAPPPTANAGTAQTITLPTNQATLSGSGTVSNGGAIVYSWTQVGGTAATIGSTTTSSTNITGLTTAGVRTFRLTVTQSDGQTATSDVTVTVNPAQVIPPPTANSGTAQTITLPTNQATLSGSGTVSNGGAIVYSWTQVGGTAATIASANTASTNITGLTTAGVRTFRLTVTQSDGQTATSDVTVTVNPATGPAGKTIPGKIEAEAWDAKSGGMYPLATNDAGGGQHVVGIANGNWMDYNVTVTQSGTYTVNFRVATTQPNTQLQLKLGATVLGTVTIPSTGSWDTWAAIPLTNVSLTAGVQALRILCVTSASANFNWMDFVLTSAPAPPPTANAGTAQTITLPTNQAALSGSGTVSNGGAIVYSWTQVGGTAATIASANTASTNITGLTTAGVRTFRLTVTQSDGQTATSDVTVTVNPAQVIPPPTANSGTAQTITLPTNQATLSGSGTVSNGGAIVYSWTQVGGTAATIASANTASTNITGLTTAGVRTFRLTVTQSDGQTATSDVTVTVNPATGPAGKTIPGKIEAEGWDAKSGGMYPLATNDAGGGQHVVGIANGNWMDYNVTVTQSGTYTVNFRVATTQPNTQLQLKLGATVLGTVTIPSTGSWDTWAAIPLTNISLTAGAQTLRIQSTTAATCNFNWMDFVLTSAPAPPPTANAGTAQTITLPTNQATLSGSGTVSNGGAIVYSWTQVGGTAATIGSTTTSSTNITGLTTAGVRTFRLTVTQSDGQTATSDVTVTVNPAQVIPPPTANSGTAQTITLPTNQATLSGSGTVSNGGAIVYSWTQVGGTAATIASANTASTNITGLTTAGVRTFRLTVTQSDGQTATSDVTVTVNPATGPAGKTIPGKIEAEGWDAKSGGMYPLATNDAGGGQHVVGIANGNWMDYNVTVTQSGTYTVNFRVATTQPNTQLQLKLGATVLGTVTIPSTGSWDTWAAIPLTNISLTAGAQTLRIQSTTAATCNFNWMDFVLAIPALPRTASTGEKQPLTTENTIAAPQFKIFPNPVTDQFVLLAENNYEGTVEIKVLDQNGNIMKQVRIMKNRGVTRMSISAAGISAGIYIIRVQMGDRVSVVKMIKL